MTRTLLFTSMSNIEFDEFTGARRSRTFLGSKNSLVIDDEKNGRRFLATLCAFEVEKHTVD